MARFLVLAAVALQGALATVDESQYRFYIETALNRTDTNNDGEITCSTEWATMVSDVLDAACPATGSYTNGSCIEQDLCTNADGNGDGSVTQTELIDFVTNTANYEGTDQQYWEDIMGLFIRGLTNVNLDMGSMTEGIGEVNPCIADSAATLTIEVTSPLNLDSFLAGDRKLLQCNVEFAMGLRQSVRPCTPDQCTKLTLTAGSTVISTRLYYTSLADADAAAVTAQTQFGTTAAASTALGGYEVTAVSPPVVAAVSGHYEIEYHILGPIGGGFFLVIIGSIVAAIMMAKKQTKLGGIASKGCCSTGCCSAYTIKSWSYSMIFGVVLMAVAAVLLYLAMGPVQDNAICIVDGIYDLQAMDLATVQEVASAIPTNYIDPIRSRLNLLSVAVIVPAALAAILILLAALLSFRKSKTMCCPKFFETLAYLILIVCTVFYLIFAGLAVAINYNDTIGGYVDSATSICDDNVPDWTQLLADSTAARDRAAASGMNTSDFDQMIGDWGPAVSSLGSTCTCITDLFNDFPTLVTPGLCTVLSIIYLFIVTATQCSAAKCCKSPLITGKSTTISKGDDAVQEV